MRRIMLHLLAAVLLASIVVGCGPRASSSPVLTATAAVPASPVVEQVLPTATRLPDPATRPLPTATPLPTFMPSPSPSAVPSPSPLPAVSLFGIQMEEPATGGQLDLALEAGPHWLRFLTLEWDKIEPERTDPPTYHWEAVDEAFLREASGRGLEVIALVQFTPAWAQAIPGSSCGPFAAEALPDLDRFLRAAVSRYSVPPYRVRYWELGNEPDVAPSLVTSGIWTPAACCTTQLPSRCSPRLSGLRWATVATPRWPTTMSAWPATIGATRQSTFSPRY